MKTARKIFRSAGLVALAATLLGADWRAAEPGWNYDFPRDHQVHPEFKTEWWYFTGNLFDQSGRRFGFELTFFRQGLRSAAERNPAESRWLASDLKFAHFTVTDIAGKRFRFQQRTSRGAFGESGFSEGERLAWIDSWNLARHADGSFDLKAEAPEEAIDLHLVPLGPPVVHGVDGISAKAAGAGHASHYYSLPHLTTTGHIHAGGQQFAVRGESWFDHEWATNQLAPEQSGWNWLSVQWEDGSALMLYQMRLLDGRIDPASSGTSIAPDGSSTHLAFSDYQMTPVRSWKSKTTGADYPVDWKIEIPSQEIAFTVTAALDNQELALIPLTYWEGAIDVQGTRAGKAVRGRGYLELTGYTGGLEQLSR